MTELAAVIANKYKPVHFLVSTSYLNFHPSNGFAKLEHYKDQT